jgi:hypothetical protein
LAAHDVFAAQEGGWVHTPMSRLLRDDHPATMRSFARLSGQPYLLGSWAALMHSIRTGTTAGETLDPRGMWAYLQDHPEEAEIFGLAMKAKAGADIAAVLAAYDFTRFGTIADIGGGRGHLLRAVLDTTLTTEGILFDRPEVIDIVDVDPLRLTMQAGDFFVDPLPSADAYLLMDVLHDWADQECAAILSAVRKAAPTGSTLLVIEGVLTEGQTYPIALTMDVTMLVLTGGRERTPKQLSGLLKQAGFEVTQLIDTSTRMRIVEASAVGPFRGTNVEPVVRRSV